MARRRDSEVLAEALRLPLKQRARVAHELIASLDDAAEEDPATVASAWHDEIARRLEQILRSLATSRRPRSRRAG
jgi:hypothetical protein